MSYSYIICIELKKTLFQLVVKHYFQIVGTQNSSQNWSFCGARLQASHKMHFLSFLFCLIPHNVHHMHYTLVLWNPVIALYVLVIIYFIIVPVGPLGLNYKKMSYIKDVNLTTILLLLKFPILFYQQYATIKVSYTILLVVCCY